jgi:hypothetical protein
VEECFIVFEWGKGCELRGMFVFHREYGQERELRGIVFIVL